MRRDEAEESSPGGSVGTRSCSPSRLINALARGAEGALAMIAAGPQGSLMPVPEMYMQKLIVAGQAAAPSTSTPPVGDNIQGVAAALGRSPSELMVVVLDRPRHEELVAQITGRGRSAQAHRRR